jgi:hypothetical protein
LPAEGDTRRRAKKRRRQSEGANESRLQQRAKGERTKDGREPQTPTGAPYRLERERGRGREREREREREGTVRRVLFNSYKQSRR